MNNSHTPAPTSPLKVSSGSHKFLPIASKFTDKKIKMPESQKTEYKMSLWGDAEFTKYCLNKTTWDTKDHDNFKILMDIPLNDNGYYKDIYGQRISYEGIRTLKKPHTEINLSDIHLNEIQKCKDDFKYFRANYCLITTSSGLARPEPRPYQEQLEDELLTLDDTVILYPRQCISADTELTINEENTTALDFFELCKLEDAYYKEPRKSKITYKSFIKTLNNIEEYQKERIIELIDAINDGFIGLKYKRWIKGFLEGNIKTSYVHQLIKINEYNKHNKPSANTLEKSILLYGEKGVEKYKNQTNKFQSGEKNPRYQHNGKFSACENFCKYEHLEPDEIDFNIDVFKGDYEII